MVHKISKKEMRRRLMVVAMIFGIAYAGFLLSIFELIGYLYGKTTWWISVLSFLGGYFAIAYVPIRFIRLFERIIKKWDL